MGCGCSTTRMESTIKQYGGMPLDLDVLLKAYAEDMWQLAGHSPKLDDVRFEFDWRYVKIMPQEPKYNNSVNVNKDNGSPKILKIYSSLHTNDTDLEQEYTVTDTRKTVSTAAVQVTSGMVLSHQGLNLELPKTQDSGLPRYIAICQAGNSDEVKEEISWTIGSRIKAKKRSKVKVTMTVKEQQFSKSFDLPCVIKGKIRINTYKKDKWLRCMEGHMSEIISRGKSLGLAAENWTVDTAEGSATCIIKGNLFMRFQVEKNERAREMGLEDEDSADDYSTTSSQNESTHRRPYKAIASPSRKPTITSSSGVQMDYNRSLTDDLDLL